MAFNVKLYGTDIILSEMNAPSVTTITTEASDLVTWELTVEGLYPSFSNSDAEEYAGQSYSGKDITLEFKAKTLPFAFPSVSTSIQEYYNFPIFKKNFHFLDVGDFPLFPSEYGTQYCFRVAIVGISIEHLNEQGAKTIELTLKAGYKL